MTWRSKSADDTRHVEIQVLVRLRGDGDGAGFVQLTFVAGAVLLIFASMGIGTSFFSWLGSSLRVDVEGSPLVWMDPLFWQFFTACLCLPVLVVYVWYVVWPIRDRRLAILLAGLFGLVTAGLAVSYAKLGFPGLLRPTVVVDHGLAVTSTLRRILAALPFMSMTPVIDAPSGFASRQTILFLVLLSLCAHPTVRSAIRAPIRVAILVLGSVSSLVVLCQRILSREHSLFGVAAGIAAGVIGFWLLELVVASASGLSVENQLGAVLVWVFLLFSLFVVYGGALVWWAAAWLTLLVIAGVALMFDERRRFTGDAA